MMEFLLYLSPDGKDVYNLLQQKINFAENTSLCKKHDIYGMYDSQKKLMTFCTNRIKSNGNAHYYVNETLFHESTHVAQSCKSFFGNKIVPFWISKSLMVLSERRKNDLNFIVSNLPKTEEKQVEHEAFWMEDKPYKVKSVLKKFCF